MTPTPTVTTVPDGARRWWIECVSETMLMKAGAWNALERRYHFELEDAGASLSDVPASHWTKATCFVLIDELKPGRLYKVKLGGRFSDEVTFVAGPEIFRAYGFDPPPVKD